MIFFSRFCVQSSSVVHLASYAMGIEGKARPGRDADHSSPSSAEVKNEWEPYPLSFGTYMVVADGCSIMPLKYFIHFSFFD
jgi:hypothetical protein